MTAVKPGDLVSWRIAQQYPDTNRDKGARLVPLRDQMVSGYKSTLWILLGPA